jgi:hypothetical protein
MTIRHLIPAIALTVTAPGAFAASTILQYDTAASTTNATLAASVADPAITADALSAGPGLVPNSGSTWNWRDWDTASTSFSEAVAAGDFWTFGFEVTGNVFVSPTALDIRLDRSGSGPDDFELVASVNDGAPISVLSFDYGDASSGVDFVDVDLTALGQLGPGDSVVFTIAAFNSESSAGTFDLETVDFNGADPRSLRLLGDVAPVPVPPAFALFGASLLTLLRRRRG